MTIIDQILHITSAFPEAQHRDLLEMLFIDTFGLLPGDEIVTVNGEPAVMQ